MLKVHGNLRYNNLKEKFSIANNYKNENELQICEPLVEVERYSLSQYTFKYLQ